VSFLCIVALGCYSVVHVSFVCIVALGCYGVVHVSFLCIVALACSGSNSNGTIPTSARRPQHNIPTDRGQHIRAITTYTTMTPQHSKTPHTHIHEMMICVMMCWCFCCVCSFGRSLLPSTMTMAIPHPNVSRPTANMRDTTYNRTQQHNNTTHHNTTQQTTQHNTQPPNILYIHVYIHKCRSNPYHSCRNDEE
jgi:hypothetical protein